MPQEEKAAASLQAAARGRSTRVEATQRQEAATKLQSVQRSRSSRRLSAAADAVAVGGAGKLKTATQMAALHLLTGRLAPPSRLALRPEQHEGHQHHLNPLMKHAP